jgi:phosphonate degradation associated HDIG domain protein
MSPSSVIDNIFRLFNERGHRHYGEQVSEREHALQTATFAQQFGEPAPVVAAALLHDYGHLIHDLGEDIANHGIDARHEVLGADRLALSFGAEVVEPIRLHVAAKRYLCWKDRAYFDSLSPESRTSLGLQGGPMTDAEAQAFEQNPHHAAAVRLRRYDDMGKVSGMQTPDLEHFRPLLERLVQT